MCSPFEHLVLGPRVSLEKCSLGTRCLRETADPRTNVFPRTSGHMYMYVLTSRPAHILKTHQHSGHWYSDVTQLQKDT